MTRYFYKSKSSDRYEPSLVDNPVAWLVVCLAIIVVAIVLQSKGINFNGYVLKIGIIALIIIAIISGYEYFNLKKNLKSISNCLSYLANFGLIQIITRNLVETRTTGGATSRSFLRVPKIWLYKDNNDYYVKVAKIAGLEATDMDALAELISSSIGEGYDVISKKISVDSNWFEFVVGQVAPCPLIPSSLEDLDTHDAYKLKLMDNLVIDMHKLPHLAVYGLTGSGKSTLLYACILELLISRRRDGEQAEMVFLDGKNEFSSLSTFYPAERFASEPADVIHVLDVVNDVLDKRSRQIAEEVKKRKQIGLDAYALGLPPLYLIIDEFASIQVKFQTAKEKKELMSKLLPVLMKGRSLGVYVLYASQDDSTKTLDSSIRAQFGTTVLLGSSSQDVQRMAFNQVTNVGQVDRFSGYYLQARADMPTPQRIWVPNLIENNLSNLAAFEQAYKMHDNSIQKLILNFR